MAVSQVITRKLKDAAKQFLKRLLTWMSKDLTKQALKKGGWEVLKNVAQDQALGTFCEVMKLSASEYAKRQMAAIRNVEDYLDAVFRDRVMGVGNIQVIAPTVMNCDSYKDEILPHQLVELMRKTIKWGQEQVTQLWETHVNPSAIAKYAGVATGVQDMWTATLGPEIDRAKAVVERRQREEVARMRRELADLARKSPTVYSLVTLDKAVDQSKFHNQFCTLVTRFLIEPSRYALKNGGRIAVLEDFADHPGLKRLIRQERIRRLGVEHAEPPRPIYHIKITGSTFPTTNSYHGYIAWIMVEFVDLLSQKATWYHFMIDGKPTLGFVIGWSRQPSLAEDRAKLEYFARQVGLAFVDMVNRWR